MAAVPKLFHFVFGLKQQTEPFSLLHYLTLRSCLEVNNPKAIMLHLEHRPWGPLWDAIEPYLELCPIRQPMPLLGYSYQEGSASAAFRYAHVSDFLRVDLLHRYGGVYADMDTLFIKPYPAALYEHDFVTYEHGGGSLCNALFFCAPAAQFAEIWRREMERAFDGNWSRHSTFLPFALSRQHPSLIHVEPSTSFFHLDWTREGIRDLFERNVYLPEHVYSLHLWSHLWKDRDRVDNTRFHEGRLTADYIQHADTTYARHARHWLPAGRPAGSYLPWRFGHLVRQTSDALQTANEKGMAIARRGVHALTRRGRKQA